MDFLDREGELERLSNLMSRGEAALAVLYGHRRIGKTRLALEWTRKHGGVYTVADRSVAVLQRRRMAATLSTKLPGFGDVEYPTWDAFFARLAREASTRGWTGPVVFDELPYLVAESPELPSILQRWVDHEAKDAGLVVALAGSSQRMMQGLVLDANEPLYGRATVVLDLGPLPARMVSVVSQDGDELDFLTAWGGVPRYWELASGLGRARDTVDQLVLDPLGPLRERTVDRGSGATLGRQPAGRQLQLPLRSGQRRQRGADVRGGQRCQRELGRQPVRREPGPAQLRVATRAGAASDGHRDHGDHGEPPDGEERRIRRALQRRRGGGRRGRLGPRRRRRTASR